MKTSHLLTALIALVCLATSCVPESEQPLSPVETAKQDKKLTGAWIGKGPDNDETFWFHFVEAENGMTDIVMVGAEEKGANVVFFKMHPTAIGDRSYMNIKQFVPEDYLSPKMEKELENARYNLMKYELSDDTLKIWMMVNEIEEAITEGKLKGKVDTEGFIKEVTITDAPENIAKFLKEADHEKIFKLVMICKKAKTTPLKDDPQEDK